jgi:hypothetical protein
MSAAAASASGSNAALVWADQAILAAHAAQAVHEIAQTQAAQIAQEAAAAAAAMAISAGGAVSGRVMDSVIAEVAVTAAVVAAAVAARQAAKRADNVAGRTAAHVALAFFPTQVTATRYQQSLEALRRTRAALTSELSVAGMRIEQARALNKASGSMRPRPRTGVGLGPRTGVGLGPRTCNAEVAAIVAGGGAGGAAGGGGQGVERSGREGSRLHVSHAVAHAALTYPADDGDNDKRKGKEAVQARLEAMQANMAVDVAVAGAADVPPLADAPHATDTAQAADSLQETDTPRAAVLIARVRCLETAMVEEDSRLVRLETVVAWEDPLPLPLPPPPPVPAPPPPALPLAPAVAPPMSAAVPPMPKPSTVPAPAAPAPATAALAVPSAIPAPPSANAFHGGEGTLAPAQSALRLVPRAALGPRPAVRSIEGLDRIAALTGALQEELSRIRGRICQ